MSPAVKMAEIQQIELSVVLRVVDGVNILKQRRPRENKRKERMKQTVAERGRNIMDSCIKKVPFFTIVQKPGVY